MGASKRAFEEMREEEIQQSNQSFYIPLFDSTFTKKEAKQTGENLIIQSIESGEIGKFELMANLVRLQEVINSAVGKLREELPYQDMQTMGVKFSPNNGRKMLQYSDDFLWNELNKKIKDREEILKLSSNTTEIIFDNDGIEIPKCEIKYSKSSINITF